MAAILKGGGHMHHGTMSPERRRKATTLLPAEHHRSSTRQGVAAAALHQSHVLAATALQPQQQQQPSTAQQQQQLIAQSASSNQPGNECRPEAPCAKCRQACTCSWCEEQGNTCTNHQSCSMRGKQCATCNASECRGKRAKRLRAHLGITEVRRPGYSSAQSNYHHTLPRASYSGAVSERSGGSSSGSYTLTSQSAAGLQVGPIGAGSAQSSHNWGARAVFGDHKYPTIRTGAPSTRVQMDALMHKCTMAATSGRQWQRVSTRDPQLGSYACREDNNNNIRLELSGAVLSKLIGFVVVASVAAELGLDKIPDSAVIQGVVVLTAGHNVDVEPWGAPDHHQALLLITVAGDTVIAVAKTDGTAHHQQHPLPNLFRTNPAQSNCLFQLFYASRGDLVYVPPGASYQTRHIGNDHILLVVKVDPLSFTTFDSSVSPSSCSATARLTQLVAPSPVSYLAYPLGGAANHLASSAPSTSAPSSMVVNAVVNHDTAPTLPATLAAVQQVNRRPPPPFAPSPAPLESARLP